MIYKLDISRPLVLTKLRFTPGRSFVAPHLSLLPPSRARCVLVCFTHSAAFPVFIWVNDGSTTYRARSCDFAGGR